MPFLDRHGIRLADRGGGGCPAAGASEGHAARAGGVHKGSPGEDSAKFSADRRTRGAIERRRGTLIFPPARRLFYRHLYQGSHTSTRLAWLTAGPRPAYRYPVAQS